MNKYLIKLGLASLAIAASGIPVAHAQETLANRDRVERFQDKGGQTGLGGWGVRILHTTSYDDYHQLDGTGVTVDTFDVDNFMAQLDELDTITHVMVNLSRGHQATWHSAPWPSKAGVPNLQTYMQDSNGNDYFFPDRDLLGELLDAIQARGLKTLVYYSRYGFDESYMTDSGNLNAGATYSGAWQNWLSWINAATGTNDVYVGAAALLERYAEHYGDRIDGWWIDRCYSTDAADEARFAAAARAGNPNAIVTMHTGGTGFVTQGTPECDYTGGHPRAMNTQVPWTTQEQDGSGRTGYDMVEKIESGPFLIKDPNSTWGALPSTSQNAALGHIFMPFQSKWRDGDDFPQATLEIFTERTVAAGGLYTWAVERVGSGFATSRQAQLVALDAHMKSEFPDLGPDDSNGISYWDFDEGSGNTAADVSSGFDASISGASWTTPGASGSALDFDGNDAVSVPAAAFNAIEASDEVSFAAWVDGANGAILRAGDASGRVLSAVFNSNGKLYWDAGNSGTSSYDRISKTVSPSEHSGGWSHWVFTKNSASGSMNIYRNGALWHSGTGKTRTINNVTSGHIGAANGNGSNGFDGLLDEAILYNYELTAAEVADLYNMQGDLGVSISALTYDEESHPNNNSIIVVAGPKVGKIKDGSWIRFDDFNFGTGASSIVINAGAVGAGGTVQVRKGSATGSLLGSVTVTDTGGDWNTFLPFTTALSGATGVDDLYLVFVGSGNYLLTVESFQVD